MNLKELDRLYEVKKEVENVKSVLLMICNDISNPSGSVSTHVMKDVLSCAVKSLEMTIENVEASLYINYR